MRRYLYIQFIIFLILILSATVVTYLNLSKIHNTLHLVINAGESMRLRDTLFQDVELFSKSPTKENLRSIKETLKTCTGCHHDSENKEKIERIKKLVTLLEDDPQNKALSSRLRELTFEAATRGKELVKKRSEVALNLSNRLFVAFFSSVAGFLIFFVLINYLIFRRAEKTINNVIKATDDVSKGILVNKELFKDEFSKIGQAFEELQQDLKIKEEKLTNWAKNWKLAFDSIDEMMTVCDKSGMIIIASRSFKSLFGEDVEGKVIYDIVCARFNCQKDCAIKKALDNGKPAEKVLSSKGLIISVKTYPLFDREGNITGCIWVGRDITREKEYEERAFQSEKLVALGELVAGIAHEINNPLSVVVGYTELMLQSNQLNEQDRKRLDKIFQSATRAANIISNLLEFARKRSPEQNVINLNTVSDQIVDLIAYELRSDGIALKREYDPNVPSILGDKTQIGQVILNVLKNAHDAVAEKHKDGEGEITIKTYHDQDRVHLEVIDNGTGIEEQNLNRVFEPFFTTKDVDKGTGLGLSITYSIVKAHGGDILIKNRPEGGIIVHISFPRGDRTQNAEE